MTPAWEMLFFRLRDHVGGSAQEWEPSQTRIPPPPPPPPHKQEDREQSGGNPCSYRSSSDVGHKRKVRAQPEAGACKSDRL